MTAMTLPQDFEAWAQNEVDAGRASDVAEVARAALADYRRHRDEAQLVAFRRTLDEAEQSIREGKGIPADVVFAEVRAQIRARARS